MGTLDNIIAAYIKSLQQGGPDDQIRALNLDLEGYEARRAALLGLPPPPSRTAGGKIQRVGNPATFANISSASAIESMLHSARFKVYVDRAQQEEHDQRVADLKARLKELRPQGEGSGISERDRRKF